MKPRPDNCPLAVGSLILGVLAILCLGPFTGLPVVICGHVARWKIRHSGGTLAGNGMAIAGMATGYVGTVVFIMLGIMIARADVSASPAFEEARAEAGKEICINHLMLIEIAKMKWLLDHPEAKKGHELNPEDINPYLKHHLKHPFEKMKCPMGGIRTIHPVGERPTCSYPGHDLSEFMDE